MLFLQRSYKSYYFFNKCAKFLRKLPTLANKRVEIRKVEFHIFSNNWSNLTRLKNCLSVIISFQTLSWYILKIQEQKFQITLKTTTWHSHKENFLPWAESFRDYFRVSFIGWGLYIYVDFNLRNQKTKR